MNRFPLTALEGLALLGPDARRVMVDRNANVVGQFKHYAFTVQADGTLHYRWGALTRARLIPNSTIVTFTGD